MLPQTWEVRKRVAVVVPMLFWPADRPCKPDTDFAQASTMLCISQDPNHVNEDCGGYKVGTVRFGTGRQLLASTA
jgi:hypothetical protein